MTARATIRILITVLLTACVGSDLSTAEQPVETYAEWLIAPGGGDVNYSLLVDNGVDTGTHNYGIQVRNQASSGQKFGIHVNANGANGTNYGILVGASNGQNNRALQTNHGDVILNADSGKTQITRNVSLGSTNDHLRTLWGHSSLMGTAPTIACGAGASVVGVDAGGVVTAGDALSCTLTFSRAFNREVSCTVTARDGVLVSYSVAGTALTLTSAAVGSRYDYRCDCIGGGGCQ